MKKKSKQTAWQKAFSAGFTGKKVASTKKKKTRRKVSKKRSY